MLKITKDQTKKMALVIKEMANRRVKVGVPQGESNRSDGVNNAQLAYIHENGAPASGIPPRPFLGVGVKNAMPQVKKALGVYGRRAFDTTGAFEQGMDAIGLIAQTSVKKAIVAGSGFSPLKPATIKARERKGFLGKKPLIRTGSLLNSISYVVEDK